VSRRRALLLARALIVRLESPMDYMLRIIWQEPEFAVALKVCSDLNVFNILAKTNQFMSVGEISELITGVDTNLLQRLMRHIAAMGALREEAPDKYASTLFTNALTRKEINGGLETYFNLSTPMCLSLPKFLEQTGYKEPLNPEKGNWMFTMNTQLQYFDWLNEHPKLLSSFANFMSGYASDSGIWLDVYPIERLLNGAAPDGPLLVDIGGGVGHDIEKFRKKHPQDRGRLIVQDLPQIIAEGKEQVDRTIEMMEHDFFTPQPVKSK
jgi:O-methyltransferase